MAATAPDSGGGTTSPGGDGTGADAVPSGTRADGTALGARAHGEGTPLLLIPTTAAAEHLDPLARQPRLAGTARILRYRRRGYGASPPAPRPGSLVREAADALAVLDACGTGSAHVLGDSFSVAIALELALAHPGRVRGLVLVEPPPLLAPGAEHFLAANRELLDLHESLGPVAALKALQDKVAGPHWREDLDAVVPGMSERILLDAPTVFAVDIPALLAWTLPAERAAALTCPVLHIEAGAHGSLFATVGDWLRGLLPQTRTAVIPGAGHDVAFTHPAQVAAEIAAFLTQAAPR